jgi:uncharacterized protein YjgD (DUF1641 family)
MKIEDILDKYPNDQILSHNRKSLLIFEEQRGSVVRLFMNTLSECKDNKKILDLYYKDLYFYISIIQISVIILSVISAFVQAIQMEVQFPSSLIPIFLLCVSTYISLIMSLSKFFKLDEKKESSNNLKEKYAEIQNEIRFVLDKLKAWKEPWYLDTTNLDEGLNNWKKLYDELNTEYNQLIKKKQALRTDYETALQSHKTIKKYKKRILEDEIEYQNEKNELLGDLNVDDISNHTLNLSRNDPNNISVTDL